MLVKPSHYDDDGYVIQWLRSAVPSNSLAVVSLVLMSPLLALIALAIRLEGPGPVLFRQKRFGFNNHEIEVYKFRTMHSHMVDHDGANQASRLLVKPCSYHLTVHDCTTTIRRQPPRP